MNDDTADVMKLPVRPRRHDLGDRMLAPVVGVKCFHDHTYIVDEREAEVTCSGCGAKLDPIWVLLQLMRKESRWHEFHARYQDELARLNARLRTKCQHCGGMTRITRG